MDPSRTTASGTVIRRLQELIARNSEGDLELLRRLASLFQEAARRPVDRGADGGRLVEQSAELLLDWYTNLSRHRLAFLEESLSALERSLGVAPRSSAPESPAEDTSGDSARAARAAAPAETKPKPGGVSELRLAAHPGETVAARFLVENNYPYAMTLSLRAEAVEPGPAELPADWVSFHPQPLRIAPRSKVVAEVRVSVPEELGPDFAGGTRTLSTTIRLHGLEASRVPLTVHVLAAETAERPKEKATATRKGRRPGKTGGAPVEPTAEARATSRKKPRGRSATQPSSAKGKKKAPVAKGGRTGSAKSRGGST